LVVDQGFEPCRSSPSDQSPGIIRPRRTPVLSTIYLLYDSIYSVSTINLSKIYCQ